MITNDPIQYEWLNRQLIKDVTIAFHSSGYSVTWNREVHPVTDVYTTLEQVKKALEDVEYVNARVKAAMKRIEVKVDVL